ncbi:hypothetical protein LME23_002765 [Salmonella enterica]|nr:hypothetical protein [Salmonella enterica]EIL8353109.1 hypothetical protein [Salmonella enterica]
MDISAVIFATHRIRLLPDEGKIPWDEPAFSQRMLENHLSQDHDWASRRLSHVFLPLAKANTVSIIRLQRKSTPHWAMRYA